MLQTVEGIIDVDGQIRWLEPLRKDGKSHLSVVNFDLNHAEEVVNLSDSNERQVTIL